MIIVQFVSEINNSKLFFTALYNSISVLVSPHLGSELCINENGLYCAGKVYSSVKEILLTNMPSKENRRLESKGCDDQNDWQ